MTLSERPETNFTDVDWQRHLEALDIPHLNEWMRSQAKRGQDYYLRRLDRLGFSGGSVLDAGCGVGNWTIALSRRFEHVEAIDNDAERVGVLSNLIPHMGGSVEASVGSVTDLKFSDSSFDAVFCNGVVFLTDTDLALAEFVRVLRPGGRLYVTYNGPAWWRHLIHERALSEPVCYMYGANGLITWAFRLLGEIDFSQVVSPSDREAMLRDFAVGSPETLQAVREILVRSKAAGMSGRRCQDLLACIDDLSTPGVDHTYVERLVTDAFSRIANGTPKHEVLVHTYTHRPEDMTEMLSNLGMVDIVSATEGGLCLIADSPSVSPIYSPNLGVFESFGWKS